jgi:hypothetical protein
LQFPSQQWSNENLINLDANEIKTDSSKQEDTRDSSNFKIKRSEQKSAVLQIGGKEFGTENELKQLVDADQLKLDSFLLSKDVKPNYFTRNLLKQLIKTAKGNEDFFHRFKENIIHNSSMAIFILMPLFALLLQISYLRRKKNYYEYLIFSIHYHTVVFIIFSFLILINIFIDLPGTIYLICITGLLYYLASALRKNYQGSRSRTILRLLFICFFYFLFAIIVMLIVLILGWWFV